MITPITPKGIAPPLAAYSHGMAADLSRLVVTSGQLGIRPDGSIPEGAEAQARQCFANLDAILGAEGLGAAQVMRLNGYVTDRAHLAGYLAARDAWVAGLSAPPASTLVIVTGFTRPEFLVEIEAIAAVPA